MEDRLWPNLFFIYQKVQLFFLPVAQLCFKNTFGASTMFLDNPALLGQNDKGRNTWSICCFWNIPSAVGSVPSFCEVEVLGECGFYLTTKKENMKFGGKKGISNLFNIRKLMKISSSGMLEIILCALVKITPYVDLFWI